MVEGFVEVVLVEVVLVVVEVVEVEVVLLTSIGASTRVTLMNLNLPTLPSHSPSQVPEGCWGRRRRRRGSRSRRGMRSRSKKG